MRYDSTRGYPLKDGLAIKAYNGNGCYPREGELPEGEEHELRHAYDAKRCASYVNLKGIDFDCEPLATSAYVAEQNTTGFEYEQWTDERAADDYFTAFRTPAYRGDPLEREYDPDAHP